VTIAETRYGRRGGGWLPAPPAAPAEAPQQRRPLDLTRRSHPSAIAVDRAHRRTPTCPAHKPKSKRTEDCTCTADPADLAAIWAGRARMARARTAAGRPLDRLDHEAVQRQEMTT
jgi:hypothetical protein